MDGKGYYIAQGFIAFTLVLVSLSAAGCDVIGGIFKLGFWSAIVMVAVVVGGVVLIAGMFRK